MYARFYHLRKEPFHVTPDPEFFYLGPTHKEALASIVYGVNARKGFVVITGEVGVGKTTVLRTYLERIDREHNRVIYVFNPNITFKELLAHMFQELSVDFKTGDTNKMVNRLHQLMIEEYREGRHVVLLIDEAQNIPVETLENLRMLSNLETSTDKLIQIVLVGQPEFENILDRKELRQLKQRTALHCVILPLTRKESLAYVRHRLVKAGMNHAPIFTRWAVRRIAKSAAGIPRVINTLCDNALMAGVGYRKKPVTSKIVDKVIADYEGRKQPPVRGWIAYPAAAVFAAVLVFLVSSYFKPLVSTADHRFHPIVTVDPVKGGSSTDTLEQAPAPPEVPPTGMKNVMDISTPEPVVPTLGKVSGGEIPLMALSQAIEVNLSTPRPEGQGMRSTRAAPLSSPKSQAEGLEVHPEPRLSTPTSKAGLRAVERVKPALDTSFPVIRVVKQGQNLFRLTREVYGRADDHLVQWVKDQNPWIGDIERIPAGREVIFPKPPEG